ncbi:MAG TPA: alpha/beta fold hydrolase [Marmoricola sp.]|nr:alpha/beta fold hydrolase [Marmoricola sp.]
MSEPHLTRSPCRRTPRGLVLMLHGGAEQNIDPVTAHSRPWQRSRLMMAQLQRPFHKAGLEVWLLRYRFTGWNHGHGSHPSPVGDARWALDEVRAAHGSLPVVVLGHSMGARTGATVADDPNVRGLVALAPWFPPGEPVQPLAGRHLVAAHGRADRVTSFGATTSFVHRAEGVAASVGLVDMAELGHYMLKGISRWNEVALQRTTAMFDHVTP